MLKTLNDLEKSSGHMDKYRGIWLTNGSIILKHDFTTTTYQWKNIKIRNYDLGMSLYVKICSNKRHEVKHAQNEPKIDRLGLKIDEM